MKRQAFTVNEVAAMTGLHSETVRRAVRSGDLAAMRVSDSAKSALRFSRVALNEWWEAKGGGLLFMSDAVEGETA